MPEAAPSSAPLIIEDVAHAYADQPVLAGLSCELRPGELLAVLGPSGCGKTTLLRAVAGLLTPDRGRISINGEVVCDNGRTLVAVEQRRIGLVFQDYALFGQMTVRDNVAFGLPRDRRQETDALLDLVGLRDFAHRRPHELSGGQQQRVAVARALAPNPRLMLLDEPFANLDPSLRDDLGVQVRAWLAERGTAGLLVTHDRHDALGLADRALLLLPSPRGAVMAQLGTPSELYRTPASAAVARLTGPVVALAAVGNGPTASTIFGEFPLRIAAHGALTVLARPEDLRLLPAPDGPLTVIGRRFLGASWRLRCQWAKGTCDLDAPPDALPPAPGSRGTLGAAGPLWAVPQTHEAAD